MGSGKPRGATFRGFFIAAQLGQMPMNIARRDLILPAFVLGLVGVVPALAASTEEDAVANNVEAFRLAQIAADAKAFDVL